MLSGAARSEATRGAVEASLPSQKNVVGNVDTKIRGQTQFILSTIPKHCHPERGLIFARRAQRSTAVEGPCVWFGSGEFHFGNGMDQKMDMLGHHDIADDHESVFLPSLFGDGKEAVARARHIEEWQPVIARVSNKMQVMRTVSTMQAGRHNNPMLSAASFPPLQKSQEPALSVVEGTGHLQFRNRKKKEC
jgi:hypothetical protein